MTFRFKKGTHRARPLYWLRWFALLVKPKIISCIVQFDFSSKYDFGNDEQFDVNKLFGLTFGFSRKESARFGWRYAPEVNKFFLYAYTYVNGVRAFTKVCECVANHSYVCQLRVHDNYYTFTVFVQKTSEEIGFCSVEKRHQKKIAWLLGPFFGGTLPAPHNMTLKLSKR